LFVDLLIHLYLLGWGKEQEIYRCRLPRCFWGKRFDECAEALYYEYNVIAFALRRETMEQKTIHLFPYFLPVEKDDVIFIIASNSSVCNEIIKITEFPEYSKKVFHSHSHSLSSSCKCYLHLNEY
jgi:hypothetical protein